MADSEFVYFQDLDLKMSAAVNYNTMKRTMFFTFVIVHLIVLMVAVFPLAVYADGAVPYLVNPIRCPDFICLLTQIIRIFLGGVAVISTFMFIYGGYVFLTSAGNAEAVKKGKDTLFWASIGIVTVLGSWIIIQYVLRGLSDVT